VIAKCSRKRWTMASPEDAKPKMTSGFWFDEEIQESALTLRMRLEKITQDEESGYQRVQIIETTPFGKTLVLDGKTQSSAKDEHVYHETLVHPALVWHGSPKRVYVGGGGELATTRECLRHKSVESVVMVDLDEKVVDMCRRHMPEWHRGTAADPRLDLRIGDARAFLLAEDSGLFDVVVLDISDPIEAGPAVHLYTREFYDLVAKKLTPGGVVVTQSGPAGLCNYDECFTAIHNTLKSSFDHVAAFATAIPSFGSDWGFNLAWNGPLRESFGDAPLRDPAYVATVDAKLQDCISQDDDLGPLKHYDAQTHASLFNLSKDLRAGIAKEHRLITADNPVFMY